MNDEAARQGRPDTNSITCRDVSTAGGDWPCPTPHVPTVVVEIEFEGRVRLSIRGAHGDEAQAEGLRAWLEADEQLADFMDRARALRKRMAA